jgi:hypothetical protein
MREIRPRQGHVGRGRGRGRRRVHCPFDHRSRGHVSRAIASLPSSIVSDATGLSDHDVCTVCNGQNLRTVS